MATWQPTRGKAKRAVARKAARNAASAKAKRRKLAQAKRPTPAQPVPAKASPVLHATDADFDAIVAASALPVLLDLWAPWCGPCRALGPRLEEVAEKLAGQVRIVKVNVDENPALSERFNVRSIPLLVFLRGEHRASLVGLHTVAELDGWVRARLAGEPLL